MNTFEKVIGYKKEKEELFQSAIWRSIPKNMRRWA